MEVVSEQSADQQNATSSSFDFDDDESIGNDKDFVDNWFDFRDM